MNYEIANFALGIVGAAAGGIGAYVAIVRALGKLEAQAQHAVEEARRANARIDSLLKIGNR